MDALATASNAVFSDMRYGLVAEFRHKSRVFILLKPSTFMNLSGNAVSYWMKKEKIPVENLLVIVDDIAIPLGSFRMRSGGSAGGHNGLSHISSVLGTDSYARIRIGIGNTFSPGNQSGYVLGKLTPGEKEQLAPRIAIVTDMIRSFGTIGTELTMTKYNRLGKTVEKNESDGGSKD